MDKATVATRYATTLDGSAQMIRRMVADMASHGGHAPATDESAWVEVAAHVADQKHGFSVLELKMARPL